MNSQDNLILKMLDNDDFAIARNFLADHVQTGKLTEQEVTLINLHILKAMKNACIMSVLDSHIVKNL